MGIRIHNFHLIEDLLKKAEELGGVIAPTKISGAPSFFHDFSRFLFTNDESTNNSDVLTVLPIPEFNLAFPYPYDEIKSSLSKASPRNELDISTNDILNSFGINNQLSRRPTNSLSGGEKVLLSLAKAYSLEPIINKLILCSPWQFLNIANHDLVQKVINQYNKTGKDVHILNTKNEELNFISYKKKDIQWNIKLTDLEIDYLPTNFPKFSPGKKITFKNFNSGSISSPTLLRGNNGIGKSVLAKTLSGLENQHTGSFRIITKGQSGKARLLMQDSTIQLFGNTPNQYLKRVTYLELDSYSELLKVYSEINTEFQKSLSKNGYKFKEDLGNWKTDPNILHAKIVLLAERIYSKPPLLILDEPSFGISQVISHALLDSITKVCHSNDIAVLIITQKKDWSSKIASSEIDLELNSNLIVPTLKEFAYV